MRLSDIHPSRMHLGKGFSMIEVLVSMLVLSIGLLGVIALQLQGLRSTQGAYQASQATAVVSNLIERMRANPDLPTVASSYAFNTGSAGDPSKPTCASSTEGCTTPSELAHYDVYYWREYVLPRLGDTTSAVVGVPDNDSDGKLDGLVTVDIKWTDLTVERDTDGKLKPRELGAEVTLWQ